MSDRDRHVIAAICMGISGDEMRWGNVAIDLLQGEDINPDDAAEIAAHLAYHPECPEGAYVDQQG